MLNELWAAEEAQAAAVISKVRCSFSLPSTQPMPIPEESEGPFSPATPAAVETPKGMPDVPDSASGGAEASSSARGGHTWRGARGRHRALTRAERAGRGGVCRQRAAARGEGRAS